MPHPHEWIRWELDNSTFSRRSVDEPTAPASPDDAPLYTLLISLVLLGVAILVYAVLNNALPMSMPDSAKPDERQGAQVVIVDTLVHAQIRRPPHPLPCTPNPLLVRRNLPRCRCTRPMAIRSKAGVVRFYCFDQQQPATTRRVRV
jgi:hypothetical protein